MRRIGDITRRIGYLLLALFILVGSSDQALALRFVEPEEISNRQKAHLDISFTGGENGQVTESVCSTNNLSGSDNKEKIYNFLKNKGLSAEQAAGAYGNIWV